MTHTVNIFYNIPVYKHVTVRVIVSMHYHMN